MADEFSYSSDDLYGQYGYEGGQNVTFSALDAIISNLRVSSAQIESLAVSKLEAGGIIANNITFTGILQGASGTFTGSVSVTGTGNYGSSYIDNTGVQNTATSDVAALRYGTLYAGKTNSPYSIMGRQDGFTFYDNRIPEPFPGAGAITESAYVTFSPIGVGITDILLEAASTQGVGKIRLNSDTVAKSLTVSGFDLILGNGDQSSRGNTGASRAMVKDFNGTLVLNYGKDFYNGVRIDSRLSVNGGAQAIALRGGTDDHVYMGFYPDSQDIDTRWGYMGFGSTGSTQMQITNEVGRITLTSQGSYLTMQQGDAAGHTFIGNGGAGLQVLGSGAGIQARNYNNTAYTNFYATAFTPSSLRELKKNIEPFVENATHLIETTNVYSYHFNEELDNELKHTGLIYDEVPYQMADIHGLGIDLYAMASIQWKSIQELSARIRALEGA